MKDKKTLIVKIAFAVAGGIGGFLYWKFVGCTTGTCPIKSVWYLSTLWGIAAGYLVGDLIQGVVGNFKRKQNDETV